MISKLWFHIWVHLLTLNKNMFFFTCRLSFVLVTGYLFSHKQRLTHININQKYKLLNQNIFLTKEIQKSCSVANWLSQSVAVDALNTCEENCYELLQMTSVPGYHNLLLLLTLLLLNIKWNWRVKNIKWLSLVCIHQETCVTALMFMCVHNTDHRWIFCKAELL